MVNKSWNVLYINVPIGPKAGVVAAGVTWGVIAHHFGSREALMLAALERASERLHEVVVEADVSGATLEERLRKYLAGYPVASRISRTVSSGRSQCGKWPQSSNQCSVASGNSSLAFSSQRNAVTRWIR